MISLLCKVFQVSHAGYYKFCKQHTTKRDADNHALMPKVKHTHQESCETYSYLCVTAAIAEKM